MKISGIIVEYNPFHNGHLHHIQQTRKITNCDLLIAVMSGNFNQRGIISIINKEEKIRAALNNGVDLVIELPVHAVLSNADIFAETAIKLLNLCKVDSIVFGSESNNIEELKEISTLNINVNHLKEMMKTGHSFAKSYGLLCGNFEANDILAIAYLKAISKINSNIKSYTIQRTNSYHSLEIKKIASATAIRNAVKNSIDYHKATKLNIKNPQFNDKFFNYLKTLLTIYNDDHFKNIYLVDEGIENHLIKSINKAINYDDFIKIAVTRRYTKARIERTIINIMLNIKKNDINNFKDLNFIRVLGFNQKARLYLKELKKDIIVATNYNQIPLTFRDLFYKSAILYTHNLEYDLKEKILKQEVSGPIIIQ